jgi:hypothetical protein
MNNEENKEQSDMIKFNHIPYRIDSIKALIENKILDSMVDFKSDTNDFLQSLLITLTSLIQHFLVFLY